MANKKGKSRNNLSERCEISKQLMVFFSCFFANTICLLCLFLELFGCLKRINEFAQECSLVGRQIQRDVLGDGRSPAELKELKTKINVSTRTLEVGAIISDEASGGPLQLTYRLKGDIHYALSTSNLVEPLAYPLFFPYGERGWGANLSPGIRWNK